MLAGPEPVAVMARPGETNPGPSGIVRDTEEPLTTSNHKAGRDPDRSPATVLDVGAEQSICEEKNFPDQMGAAEEPGHAGRDEAEPNDVSMAEANPEALQEDNLPTSEAEASGAPDTEDKVSEHTGEGPESTSAVDPEPLTTSTSLPPEVPNPADGDHWENSSQPEAQSTGEAADKPAENGHRRNRNGDEDTADAEPHATTLPESLGVELPTVELETQTQGAAAGNAADGQPVPEAAQTDCDPMDMGEAEARDENIQPAPGTSEDTNGYMPMESEDPHAAKSSLGSPTPKKVKTSHQPRMKRNQRCGHCHTCMNRQLKKACLTARSQQSKTKGKGIGARPASATDQTSSPPQPDSLDPAPSCATASAASAVPSPAAPAPAAVQETVVAPPQLWAPTPRASSQAELADKLRPLLSPKGGVEEPQKFSSFQQLMQNEMSLKGRHLFLTIVEMTASVECLKLFISSDGLSTLNQWLTETRDRGNSKSEAGAEAEAKNIWDLSKKIIGVLKILPVDINSVLKVGIGKTVRSLKGPNVSAEVKTVAKELVAQWKQMFIDNPKPAPTAADGSGKRERDGADCNTQAAKKVRKDSGLSLMEANDDSLFKSAPKPVPKMKPAAPRRKVQRLSASDLISGGSPDSPPLTSPTGAEPDQTAPSGETQQPVSKNEANAEPADTPKSSTIAIGRGAPVSNTTQAPVTVRIGMANINPGIPTAAQRAAEAAARIPDDLPEYAMRKKKKSVRWVEESDMRQIRMFWKDQPPIAVKGELNASGVDMENVHHDGFESAAKREHLLEAEAMENGRSQGGEDEDGIREPGSPSCSSPHSVQWGPPWLVLTETADVGAGEESKEKGSQAMRERSTPAASFPGGVSRTFSPAEALPLSVEEQQSLRTHRPQAIPWILPLHTSTSEQMSKEYDMQTVPAATQGAPSPPTTVTPLLQAMVSHLDPALVTSLQAITSSGPDASAPPASSRGASRQETSWEFGQRSASATGWSTGFSSGPPNSAPMGSAPQAPWPGGGSSGGGRPGSGFSDWGRGGIPRPDGWSPSGRGGPPGPGPAPNHSGSDWGMRGRGPSGGRESGWDRSREGWRDLPSGGKPPSARLGPPGQNYSPVQPPGASYRPPPPASSAKPCLFFNSPQGCRNGDGCKFAHVRKNLSQSQLTDALNAISKPGMPPRGSRW